MISNRTPANRCQASAPRLYSALFMLTAFAGCVSSVDPDCAASDCAISEDPASHASALESSTDPVMCPDATSFHSVYLTDTLCVCNEGQEDAFSYITNDGVCEAGCTAESIPTTDDACHAAVATHVPFPNPCPRGCVPDGSTFEEHAYPGAPAFCASELIQHCRPAPPRNPERIDTLERGQTDSLSELH